MKRKSAVTEGNLGTALPAEHRQNRRVICGIICQNSTTKKRLHPKKTGNPNIKKKKKKKKNQLGNQFSKPVT